MNQSEKILSICRTSSLCFQYWPSHGSCRAPLDTVAVTGTARKMVAPDMATVTFSYETTGDTVEAVRASGAQMSTKVLAKLTALGISSADRATTRYTVAPTYTYEKMDARN